MTGIPEETRLASAQLIAAAPELVKALGAIADQLEAWTEGASVAQTSAETRGDRYAAEGHYNERKNYAALSWMARAALAKVTGEVTP